MIYIDTSALLKLVKDNEREGPAMRAFLGDTARADLISSALLSVEARRGTLRESPQNLPRVDLLLRDVTTIPMSDPVVERASRLPDRLLRTLDAIHLATALMIQDDIDTLVTYDIRLATAAQAHGLAVAAPS